MGRNAAERCRQAIFCGESGRTMTAFEEGAARDQKEFSLREILSGGKGTTPSIHNTCGAIATRQVSFPSLSLFFNQAIVKKNGRNVEHERSHYLRRAIKRQGSALPTASSAISRVLI